MKRKAFIMMLSTVFALAVLGFFCIKTINAELSNSETSFTKAVCDSTNYCEDYQITCSGKNVVKLTPTGSAVQFSENWNDPRTNEDKEISCN